MIFLCKYSVCFFQCRFIGVFIYAKHLIIISFLFSHDARSRRGGGNGPMQGANIRTSVRISFDEAVFGCTKELELSVKEECKTCRGSGAGYRYGREYVIVLTTEDRMASYDNLHQNVSSWSAVYKKVNGEKGNCFKNSFLFLLYIS